MDIFLDPVNTFVPTWGDTEDWNGAYEKLDRYLKAHEIHDHLHRAWVITETLHRVEQRWKNESLPRPLPSLAIQEINEWMNQWYVEILPAHDHDSEYFATSASLGRVALYLCDCTQRWPTAFLAPGAISEEFKTSMEQGLIQAGPELELSNMVPRDIDFGLIPEIADSAMGAMQRRPIIRALVIWIPYLAYLTYLFWITR